MTLRQMMERRAALRTEMTGIHTAHPDGSLPADVQIRWDAARTEMDSIEQRMARQATIDDMDRRVSGQPLSADPRFEEHRAGIGLLDVVRAGMGATDERAGRAREISQELERRTGRAPAEGGLFWSMRSAPQTEQRTTTTGQQGTTPNGAPLVPTMQRADLFTDLLRNRLLVRQLGATVLPDLTGNVSVPRRTKSTVAYWVAENQPITASDQGFDGINMSPKTCGVLTELSRNMVLQSSPAIEALAQDDMAKVLAQALDVAAIAGDGTGYTPKGIIPQAGSAATYAKGGSPVWSDILAVLTALETASATPTAWALGSGVRAKLMATPKSPTLSLGYVMDQPGQLAGFTAAQSNNAPAGSLILGDWSDLLIGFWDEISILVNPYASGSYEKGNVQVRALMSVDVQVRRPASFAVLTQAAS